MIYFKYKTSFKKGGALTDLIEKQEIVRVEDHEALVKHYAMGGDAYAFINPYFAELESENVLTWAKTEGEAWDLFYNAQEDI